MINATSLGLKPNDDFKMILAILKKVWFILIQYTTPKTQMIKYFKSNKLKTFNGLNMLIYQGQKSFYLWNKINPEVDDELLQLLEVN